MSDFDHLASDVRERLVREIDSQIAACERNEAKIQEGLDRLAGITAKVDAVLAAEEERKRAERAELLRICNL